MGRSADAGPRLDPRAFRAREAPRGPPHLGVPARHDRDREPCAHPQGGRRRRPPLRLEPALDPGRRGRGARRRVRRPRVRDQGRGRRHLLLAHHGRGRPSPAHDDGRRRRRHRRPPFEAPRAARRDHRRHGRDDHRRHPPARARGRRQARLPHRGGERGEDEAPLRQPLRDRPVHDRRDRARHQHPPRRPALRGLRLRLGRPRCRDARPWHGGARDRHRGGSAARARGVDGRVRGPLHREGCRGRRHLLHRDRRQARPRQAPLRAHEGRRHPRQHRPLQRRDRDPRAAGHGDGDARCAPVRRGVHARRMGGVSTSSPTAVS